MDEERILGRVDHSPIVLRMALYGGAHKDVGLELLVVHTPLVDRGQAALADLRDLLHVEMRMGP